MRFAQTLKWIDENGSNRSDEGITVFEHEFYAVIRLADRYFGESDIRIVLKEWVNDDENYLIDKNTKLLIGEIVSKHEVYYMTEDEFGVYLSQCLLNMDSKNNE